MCHIASLHERTTRLQVRSQLLNSRVSALATLARRLAACSLIPCLPLLGLQSSAVETAAAAANQGAGTSAQSLPGGSWHCRFPLSGLLCIVPCTRSH